jgi:hypothetical protein
VNEQLHSAIDAQLDIAFGPVPSDLVEERGEAPDIDARHDALAYYDGQLRTRG